MSRMNNAPVAILGVASWVPSFSLFEPDVLAGRATCHTETTGKTGNS
jgi:hypothetical protein